MCKFIFLNHVSKEFIDKRISLMATLFNWTKNILKKCQLFEDTRRQREGKRVWNANRHYNCYWDMQMYRKNAFNCKHLSGRITQKLMFKVILKLDRTIARALNFISIYNYIPDKSITIFRYRNTKQFHYFYFLRFMHSSIFKRHEVMTPK